MENTRLREENATLKVHSLSQSALRMPLSACSPAAQARKAFLALATSMVSVCRLHWQVDKESLQAEIIKLRARMAESLSAKVEGKSRAGLESTIIPSEYLGLLVRKRKEGAHEEDSFDPSEYHGGAGDDAISEASFDPSEWEGGRAGDIESEGGDGGADNCGVGVTLIEDSEAFRVISLTHAGPADR